MEFLLAVFGCVLFVEGLPYALSPATFKRVLVQVLTMPERQLRVFGFSLMIAGLMVVFFARRYGG